MAKGTFGVRLKRERELREVPLNEIANATRIAPKFLEALENEQWEKLPGGVFGRGFVRSIARYLGLSEENLLAEYDLARGESAAAEQQKPEERIPAPPKWLPVLAVVVAVLAIVGLIYAGRFAWRSYKSHRDAKKGAAAAAAVAPSDSTNTAVPQNTTPPRLELLVAASRATRVRVLADGDPVFDKEIAAGDNVHLSANDRLEVTAADSGAVLLELNGRAVPPFGLPGSSGTISLTAKDLRPTTGGANQH